MQSAIPWRTVLAVGGVIIVLILGAYIYFLLSFASDRADKRAVREIASSMVEGDFTASREQAAQVLAELDPDSSYYGEAQRMYELGTFWDASSDTRLEAVRLAKQSYLDAEGNPYKQAMTINRLIGYSMSTTYDPAIVKEIFTGPPFEALASPEKKGHPLKLLAELSQSLYPSTEALFTIGTWHLGKIVRHVDGIKKLSSKKLTAEKSAILNVIEEADKLFPVEAQAAKKAPLGIGLEPSFFFTEGQLYGVLALVDPSYLEKSEEAFQRIFDYYAKISVEKGENNVELLQLRLPNTHLNMAVLINEVAGETRAADVHRHLDEVVRIVRENPDVHVRGFDAFMKALNSYAASNTSALVSHARVAKLADLHAGFRALLEVRGWKF